MLIMLLKEFRVSFFLTRLYCILYIDFLVGCPLVHSNTRQKTVDVEFMCLQVEKDVYNRTNNSKNIYIIQAFPFLKEVASDNYIKVFNTILYLLFNRYISAPL